MKRPLFLVCLCCVILSFLRLVWDAEMIERKSGTGSVSISHLFGEERLIFSGRIYKKDDNKFYLDSISIQEEAVISQQENPIKQMKVSENLICEWNRADCLNLGSFVKVKGRLWEFPEATNPGEFDSRKYYHTIQIGGKLTEVEILFVSEEYSVLKEVLYDLRIHWEKRLYQVFPQKEASIMSTMLLGDKQNLDKELEDLYKRNGIVHILSISGLHISMIGMCIYKLLRNRGVPIVCAAFLGAGIMGLYGLLTGMSISACRAIGMYLLHMLSKVCGRTYDMLIALGVMAAVMTMANPAYLQHAGFLLSFTSVLGIGVMYPALYREREEKKWQEWLTKTLLASLSITMTTLPVQLWFYYEIPTYSPVLNMIILPFMSIVLCLGLLVMLLPGVGILGTVDCVILAGYEGLCRLFNELPFHSFNPGKPKLWQIMLYYVLWLLLLYLAGSCKQRKKAAKRRGGWKLGLTFTLMLLVLLVKPGGKTKVTFLDVGQGDCICVQTSSGEVYLFDCGSTSRSKVGEYVLLPFLKYNGIRKIDAVFASHGDLDHTGGIAELLLCAREEGIVIEQLILPNIDRNDCYSQYQHLYRAVNSFGSKASPKLRYIEAGDAWICEGGYFCCLHPPRDYEEEGNAASECFYVELWNPDNKEDKLSMLLTGDVEELGELRLIEALKQNEIGEITLLKVAHHGSRYATSEEFLDVTNPGIAVISCGKNNSYGHPHEETLGRLTKRGTIIMTTSECGAVTVEMGKQIEIWRENMYK